MASYFGNYIQLIICYDACNFQQVTLLHIQSSHLNSIKHNKTTMYSTSSITNSASYSKSVPMHLLQDAATL